MSTTLACSSRSCSRAQGRDRRGARRRRARELGGWNNAGTGHAANCELNYTPMRADGSVDIAKALEVNVEFDLSRQLWSYLITKGAIASPESFIHPVPHMSFVHRRRPPVAFLKKRHAAMSAHHCYRGMEYSEDPRQIAEWAPLIMEGRDPARRWRRPTS
jgi:malate dehydrogenase (quinone)